VSGAHLLDYSDPLPPGKVRAIDLAAADLSRMVFP